MRTDKKKRNTTTISPHSQNFSILILMIMMKDVLLSLMTILLTSSEKTKKKKKLGHTTPRRLTQHSPSPFTEICSGLYVTGIIRTCFCLSFLSVVLSFSSLYCFFLFVSPPPVLLLHQAIRIRRKIRAEEGEFEEEEKQQGEE